MKGKKSLRIIGSIWLVLILVLTLVPFIGACAAPTTPTTPTTPTAPATPTAPTAPGAALEPIKIGIVYDQSSLQAYIGPSYIDGALVAIAEQNEAGGINGRPITYVIADDGSDTAKATSITTRFIEEEKVNAMTGSVSSALCIAEMQQMNKLGKWVPTMGGGMANELAEQADLKTWYFGIAGKNDWMVKSMLNDAVNVRGAKKLGCIYGKYAYGISGNEAVGRLAPQFGATLIASEAVEMTANDVTINMKRLMDAGCELVINYTSSAVTQLPIQMALQTLNWKIPVTSPEMIVEAAISAYPELFEGSLSVCYVDWRRPEIEAARQKCQLIRGHMAPATDCFAIAYDGMKILFTAMKKAKDPTNAAEVRDLLEKDTKDFPILTGIKPFTATLSADDHSICRLRPIYESVGGKRVFPD